MLFFLKLIRGNFNIDLVMRSEIPGIARVVRLVLAKKWFMLLQMMSHHRRFLISFEAGSRWGGGDRKTGSGGFEKNGHVVTAHFYQRKIT